jgi:hypothetical protein
MGSRVAWALLVVGSLIAFGCGGDGFEPRGQDGSGGGEPPSGGSGGGSSGKSEGHSDGGVSTGGTGARPSSGGNSASGGTAPSATGGSSWVPTLTGGTAPIGEVSLCPDAGTPTLERVVTSCVTDSKAAEVVLQCVSSLEESLQAAAGRYLACTDCVQVRTQVDCIVRACRNDADGVLTLQDLVQNCAWTVAAPAELAQ